MYIGNACPWCHRVLLALIVRGLLPHISYTIAADDPERASRGGWVFNTPEPVFGRDDLRCSSMPFPPSAHRSLSVLCADGEQHQDCAKLCSRHYTREGSHASAGN